MVDTSRKTTVGLHQLGATYLWEPIQLDGVLERIKRTALLPTNYDVEALAAGCTFSDRKFLEFAMHSKAIDPKLANALKTERDAAEALHKRKEAIQGGWAGCTGARARVCVKSANV